MSTKTTRIRFPHLNFVGSLPPGWGKDRRGSFCDLPANLAPSAAHRAGIRQSASRSARNLRTALGHRAGR